MAETRYTLSTLIRMKQQGEKFAMLTAYDYPTAQAAQSAGVHSLLVGDSMGMVVLGYENTRTIPLSVLLIVSEAVRRGAPNVFLVGDMPFLTMCESDAAILDAARRFQEECGCDAVKIECEPDHDRLVEKLAGAGVTTIAHLGLRPQTVVSADGYRAQARDEAGLLELVRQAQHMEQSGASMLLLEAVPPEASQAVSRAVTIPLIGCGAGLACDGHVVVTHDLLGLSAARPPKFVPVLADLRSAMRDAMSRYVRAIVAGEYPAPEHAYTMRAAPTPTH